MRCDKCGKEASQVTRLRGEKQFICRRCREEKKRQAARQPAAAPVPPQ